VSTRRPSQERGETRHRDAEKSEVGGQKSDDRWQRTSALLRESLLSAAGCSAAAIGKYFPGKLNVLLDLLGKLFGT